MTEIITDIASASEGCHLFCQRFTIELKILRNGDQVGKNARDAANPRLKRVSPIQLAKSIEGSHRRRLRVPALRGSSSNEALDPLDCAGCHGVVEQARTSSSTRKRRACRHSCAAQGSDHRAKRKGLPSRSCGKVPEVTARRTYSVGPFEHAGNDGGGVFRPKH